MGPEPQLPTPMGWHRTLCTTCAIAFFVPQADEDFTEEDEDDDDDE